jgi:hypothetical protein
MKNADAVLCVRPSLRDRFWRWLGFRYHLGDDPRREENEILDGWLCTEVKMHFGILDRVRLLLTGRLLVRTVHEFPEVVSYSKTRTDWLIYPPMDRG